MKFSFRLKTLFAFEARYFDTRACSRHISLSHFNKANQVILAQLVHGNIIKKTLNCYRGTAYFHGEVIFRCRRLIRGKIARAVNWMLYGIRHMGEEVQLRVS